MRLRDLIVAIAFVVIAGGSMLWAAQRQGDAQVKRFEELVVRIENASDKFVRASKANSCVLVIPIEERIPTDDEDCYRRFGLG